MLRTSRLDASMNAFAAATREDGGWPWGEAPAVPLRDEADWHPL